MINLSSVDLSHAVSNIQVMLLGANMQQPLEIPGEASVVY